MARKSAPGADCPQSDPIQSDLMQSGTIANTVAAGHDAISGAVDQAKATAADAIGATHEMASTAAQNAKTAGATVVSFVRENPIPMALAGVSLGWLCTCACRRGSGRSLVDYDDGADTNSWRQRDLSEECGDAGLVRKAVSQAQETIGQVAGQVKDRAGNWAGQAQDQAARAAGWSKRMFVEHPLTVGVAAAAVGAAVGLSLPQTDRESRFFAPMRRQVADKGKQKVREIGQKALDAAEQSINQAKNSIQTVGTNE